eukprot:2591109-Prymnesium_polylepis.1
MGDCAGAAAGADHKGEDRPRSRATCALDHRNGALRLRDWICLLTTSASSSRAVPHGWQYPPAAANVGNGCRRPSRASAARAANGAWLCAHRPRGGRA